MSEIICMFCCPKCKALFDDLNILLEHRDNCNGTVPPEAYVAVSAQEWHKLNTPESNGENSAEGRQYDDENGEGVTKRKRGRPSKKDKAGIDHNMQTVFVEMVELPMDSTDTDEKLATDIVSSRQQSAEANKAENGVPAVANLDPAIMASAEITIDEMKDERSQTERYSKSRSEEATLESEETPHDHDAYSKKRASGYVPRSDSPKSTDYTVSVNEGGEVYLCRYCHYETVSLHMIGRHMTAHNEHGQPFVCELCSFTSLFRGRFQAHQKKHERPFGCDLCTYRTSNLRDLKRHHLRHGGTRPHQCDQCYKSYRKQESLLIHQRTHSGDFFHCGIGHCQFKTPNQNTLEKHKSRKHNQNLEEETTTYLCQQCGFTSTNKDSFHNHQKSHLGLKDHKCPYCQYTAIKSSEVVRHMKRHVNENYYVCDRCDFGTLEAVAFEHHLMKHATIQPYSCPLCDYEDGSKNCLLQHMYEQHPGQSAPDVDEHSRMDLNVDSYRHIIAQDTMKRVVKLKLASEEREAITVDESEGVSRLSRVREVVVRGCEIGDEVVTHQCRHCRYRCYSGSALASHTIQYHDDELNGLSEDKGIFADSAVLDALCSVQAQMDIVTS